jgi:hypothetical protein
MQENPEPGIPLWFPPRVENPLQGLLEDLLGGMSLKTIGHS